MQASDYKLEIFSLYDIAKNAANAMVLSSEIKSCWAALYQMWASSILQAVVKQEYPGSLITTDTPSTPSTSRRKPRNPIPADRKVPQESE